MLTANETRQNRVDGKCSCLVMVDFGYIQHISEYQI